jgi:hypothetical protein
VLRNP